MSEQAWNPTSSIHSRNAQTQAGFYLAFFLVAGIPAVAIAWYLSRQALRWYVKLALSAWSVVWIQLLLEWLGSFHGEFLYTVALWWGGLVLASPLGAVVIEGWRIVFNFLRPRTLDENLEEQRQELARQNERLSRRAAELERREYTADSGHLKLGVFMKGDRFADHVGVKRKKDWLLLDANLLSQHMIIIGTTGAGKTETIKRLVAETLRATNHDVFLVDGKGDPTFAHEIAQMIFEARGVPIPIFKMGTGEVGSVYNGFRGEPPDVYNRLCALVGVEEASGDAQYYADINRDILQLVCFSPEGAPRSFEELLLRLDKQWLEKTYAGDFAELRNIRTIPDESFGSLLVRIRPLVRELRPVVDPAGFVLEEIPGAVFSLRTQSVGDTARRFLRFFVEDIKDFVGKRQHRPGLLIIDEFGAFQSQGIDDILTLARSSNFGVILATQDVATLGEKDMRQIIMANTRTRILHVSDFPEEVAQLAGTKMAIESSIQHSEGEPTGTGSARPQHQFRIDMNEVAQLKAGEGFLIRQRYTAKFRTKRVGEVVTTPDAVAVYEKPLIKRPAAAQQPSQKKRQKPQQDDPKPPPKPPIPDLKF